MTARDARDMALAEMERHLEEVLDGLDNEFSFQEFRQRITQTSQSAYIDLLVTCRDNDKPFGVAHQVMGNYFREIFTERHGFQREVVGRTDKNIFGDDADRIVYRR